MGEKLLLAFLGAGAFFWALQRWQKATQLAMVVLILEGALRKWVFPGSQQLIYFAKDLLLLGCYAGFLRDQGARRYRIAVSPALLSLLTLAAAWGGFEIFNPQLPNVLVGILGFKAYFFYVPLTFLLPACFENDQQLNSFLRRYCLIAIPVACLGLAQFASSPGSRINAYATGGGDEASIITFGSSEHVRVTGTFAFITGYTSYLLANVTLLLAVLGASRWHFLANRKLYLALGMSFLGMLMTGSRGPLFTLALIFPFYWYLAVMRERDAGLTVSRAGLVLGLVGAGIALFGGQALGAFLGRAAGSSDLPERIMSPLRSPFLLLPEAGVLGYGIGASHQMAAAVAPSIIPYAWLHGLNTEVESGKVMLELGFIGFLLIYLVRLLLIGLSFQYAISLHTRFHRALATGAFLYFMAELFGAPIFDVTCAVYYWFFAGLMMLAARLDRDLRLAVAPSRLARPRRGHPLPRARPAVEPALSRWRSQPSPRS